MRQAGAHSRMALSLMLVAIAGCAALKPPAPATATLRDHAPVVGSVDAGAQWPEVAWWRAYDDPALTALIERAIAQGPQIATADARIREAEQAARVAGAALGLTVDASAGFTRQRLSDNGLLPPEFLGFHWYNQSDLGITARYQFDWWGKQRAAIEAALDRTRARAAERQAAALALAAAVSEAYFGWQADSARLQLQERAVALREQLVALTERRVAAQLESADSVVQARQQLAASRETAAVLRGQRTLHEVTLAALLGTDAAGRPRLEPRALPGVRGTLPADAGTNLLARRPDILASRWRVEAALRDTDVQRASFYPDVSLRALVGLSSIDVGRLLRADSAAPMFTAAIDLPLFDAGLRRARHGAAQAALAAAIADYDSAVIHAAREAGTAAAALQQAAAQRIERQRQLEASQALTRSATARLRGGLSHRGPQLAAQLAELAEQDELVRVDLGALLADVQLRQALAGTPAPGNLPR